MSAVQLLELIRSRELGVEELTRHYLERIEKYDRGEGGLHSVSELYPQALEEARRMDAQKDRSALLFGLPILIKENIDVAGLHTTSGSLALSDNLAKTDAPIVTNLRRSGALILGKTNMTEFANYMTEGMPGGYSSRGGQVIHAYHPDKSPGGSSSGSGVAVSAGLCAAAIGTDTSFSIVGCASMNGITGLKPAHGSLSSKGILPIAHTLDTAGPMTKDMEDALLVYSGMRDTPLRPVEPTKVEDLRLAINVYHRQKMAPEQGTKMEELLDVLKGEGVHIGEVHHPHKIAEDTIMHYEFRHDLEEYLSTSNASRKTLREILSFYDEAPEERMKYGYFYLQKALEEATGKLDDAEYLEALKLRENFREKVYASLEKYDICLMTGHTGIMHFIGAPSVALRLGMTSDGAPIGMILYGKDEREVYAAALTMEKYTRPFALPESMQ